MQDIITGNTLILGIVGAIATFLMPLLFGLITKITKKELSAVTKKFIVIGISLIVTIIVVALDYTFTGVFLEDVKSFIAYLTVNSLVFLGMINVVYVNIVKMFPEIDQKLESLENVIGKISK